jgi:hypothetical protein
LVIVLQSCATAKAQQRRARPPASLHLALEGFYAGGYLALVAVQRFAPGSSEVAALVIGG